MPEEDEQGQEAQGSTEQQEPQTIEEFIAQNYPLPGGKNKPMKINAAELEAIILIPKGVKNEPPKPEGEGQKPPTQQSAPPKPQATEKPFEETRLGEQLSASQARVEQLEIKMTAIDTDRRNTLIDAIVEERMSKRYLQEDDAKKTKENLSALEAESLKALLDDARALPAFEKGKPQPQVTSREQLSEEEVERQKMREDLFGHKEPVEQWLSEQAQQGGQ